MKFTVERSALAEAALWLGGFVGNRGIAVLNAVEVHASADGLRLRRTNFEVWCETHVNADVDESGTVLVSAELLHLVATSMTGIELSMTLDDGLIVKCERSTGRLPIVDADMPTWPKEAPATSSIDARWLTHALTTVGKIAASAPIVERRVAVLDGAEESLVVLGTDSYRVVSLTSGEKWAGQSDSVAMDAAQAVNLAKSISVDAEIGWDDTTIALRSGRRTVTTRTRTDPPRLQIAKLRQAKTETLVVDAQAFRSLLTRCAKFADKIPAVDISLGDGYMDVSSVKEDAEFADSIPCSWDAQPMRLRLNAKYLDSLLALVNEGDVVVEIGSDLKPLYLAESGMESLIMPIRIPG